MLNITGVKIKKASSRNQFQDKLIAYEHRQKEFEQTRAYADERDAYVALLIASQIIMCEVGALYRRCHRIKNGWRDLRLIQSRLADLGVRLLLTMPDEQQIAMVHASNTMSYTVGVRRASNPDATSDTCIAVNRADLMELMRAVEDRCLTCDRDKIAEKKCPLRKALDAIGSNVEHDRGCGYKLI